MLAPLWLGGCETLGYLAHAASGQLSIIGSARPVERWMADPEAPAELKQRLSGARAIREFASRQLLLPDNGSYRSYAELGRAYPVWNVIAAGEFSIEPARSCFPVSGCVDYRGFFSLERAESHAHNLREHGNDVLVRGVPAYSTLGYFDDPLLSSFIHYPDTELARLLFHELAHQVVYVRDDSSFNESFAVALEREGVRRWLSAQGREQDRASFEKASARAESFNALLVRTRARLRDLYREDRAPDALAAMRSAKAREFARMMAEYAELKAGWGGFAGYDRIVGEAPNNALLVAAHTYARLVPAFEALLRESAPDLESFYARVRELAAQPAEQREANLRRLLN